MTEQTKSQPAVFNGAWLERFQDGMFAAGVDLDRPRMPTELNRPTACEVLSDHWLDETLFPPYYANRNVMRRLGKAHLKGISEGAQVEVKAVFIDGCLLKIDGHSRAAAWHQGQLTAPRFVKVLIYKVDTWEEAAALYAQYNSTATGATAAERAEHNNALEKFRPKSKLMSDSLTSVYKRMGKQYLKNDRQAIRDFMRELNILDSWNVKPPKKPSGLYCVGIKASMLWSVKNFPVAHVKDFWDTYGDLSNTNTPEVNALREEVASYEETGYSGELVINYIFEEGKKQITEYCDRRREE